jgi:geranylgeranyl pyrophosphate synthase
VVSATLPSRMPPREAASSWESLRRRVDEDLERRLLEIFPGAPPLQLRAVREALGRGKRVRASLVCLICEGLGGDIAAALPRAAVIECIQAASLIHDDYVDADTQRRGRPAAWTVQGARRAVLLGDVIFANAIRAATVLGRADGIVVAEAIATVANGAWQELAGAQDVNHAFEDPRLYDRIAFLKTGALMAAAAHLGALAAGASAPAQAKAYRFGAMVGQGYQIADDLRDIWGVTQGMERDPDQLATLVPVLLRFGRGLVPLPPSAPAALGENLPAWIQLHYATLSERMRRRVVGCLRAARTQAAGLGDAAGLCGAARAMIDAMLPVDAHSPPADPPH